MSMKIKYNQNKLASLFRFKVDNNSTFWENTRKEAFLECISSDIHQHLTLHSKAQEEKKTFMKANTCFI